MVSNTCFPAFDLVRFVLSSNVPAIVIVTVLLLSPARAGQDGTAAAADTNTSGPMSAEALIRDLSSPEYSLRQRAAELLKGVRGEDLLAVVSAVDTGSSSESVRRLIEVLEFRYQHDPLRSQELRLISNGLEKAAVSNTWFIAEAASEVLERHSARRVECAVLELVRLGVPLRPTDPASLSQAEEFDPFGGGRDVPNLKIFVDADFPDRPETYEYLRRLTPLQADVFLRQMNRASVFLVDGHRLGLEQIGRIKAALGDASVQERGKVCLGIRPDPRLSDERGVLIEHIEEDSSASDAGLEEGDLIESMDGTPLKGFDDLVTRLRSFKVGSTIQLRIIRLQTPGEGAGRDVPVKLKYWYDKQEYDADRQAILKDPDPSQDLNVKPTAEGQAQ